MKTKDFANQNDRIALVLVDKDGSSLIPEEELLARQAALKKKGVKSYVRQATHKWPPDYEVRKAPFFRGEAPPKRPRAKKAVAS